MVSKYICLTLMMIIVVVSMLELVSGEINLSDPEYLKVIAEFDRGKEWVPVIIRVTSEDVRENVVSLLPGEKIKSIYMWETTGGKEFSSEITREGLDKLVKDLNIERINLDWPLTSGLNLNQTNVDLRVYWALEEFESVLVMVDINVNISSNYSSSIKNPEERAKWKKDIKRQVDEAQTKVIPYLLEDEFKLKRVSTLSPSFSGWITKKGLEKFVNNSDIGIINFAEKIYGINNESNIILNQTKENEKSNITSNKIEEDKNKFEQDFNLLIIGAIFIFLIVLILLLIRKKS